MLYREAHVPDTADTPLVEVTDERKRDDLSSLLKSPEGLPQFHQAVVVLLATWWYVDVKY